jgi:hypothetical protein
MALADLIRGTGAAECLTVARVATIAVANPQESITSHPTVARVATVAVANAQKAILSHQDLEANVESAEFATATLATSATVAGLSATEEAVIRRWLAEIGEDDPHLVAMTLRWCQTDAASRAWALSQAAEQ